MSDENEPAFPMPHYTRPDCDIVWGSSGLTKRELFAAMAMQGILANSGCRANTYEVYAIDSVRYADALLAELAKPREQP